MDSIISDQFYEERSATSFKELVAVIDDLIGEPYEWVFRGMRDARYALVTSLDRALDAAAIDLTKAKFTEGGLLRAFQRQAHHYLDQPPHLVSMLEWLAIMQHHGAPTRLLDWSHSVYVAAYFAMAETSMRDSRPSVVWALNWAWLERDCQHAADFRAMWESDRNWEDKSNFDRLLKWKPAVLKVNAFRHSERLAIQQGTFLMSTDVSKTWEENLLESFPATSTKPFVKKIVIDPGARNSILVGLNRMNVHHGTLFPGLDGFSRALQTKLAVEGLLHPRP
jgi:FRG domain